MNPLHLFFHWPDGGVWSNLLASALWATPSFVWLDRRHKKRHQEKLAQDTLHHLQIKKRLDKLNLERQNKHVRKKRRTIS